MKAKAMTTACLAMGLALLAAARGDGPPAAAGVRDAAAIRADLTLKRLVADGRWGPITALASAAVATDPTRPVALSADDLATASAYVDNRLGEPRAYPPATPADRGRLLLEMVPAGRNTRMGLAIRWAAASLPVDDPTPRGKAAFDRLPVASNKLGATPFEHLEMLRTAAGRDRLQLMIEDLFRRARAGGLASELVVAALGSRRELDRPIGAATAELQAFDADTARPLSEAKTAKERLGRWTYRLADLQARRVQALARRILPNDPGKDALPRPPAIPPVLIDPALIMVGLIPGLADDPTIRAKAEAYDRYVEKQRDRDQITDARFMTGMVTDVLGQVNDPTVREVGRALRTGANVTFQILWASTLTTSIAMPLAILNGVSQLMALLGGGPSEMQMLREAIAELHREVRIFRRETQINFAHLDRDIHAKTDAILDHVDRLERMAERRFDEIDGRLDEIELRSIELRGIVEANHQQVLERFAEQKRLDYIFERSVFADRKGILRGADSHSQFVGEIGRFGTLFYHFATESAKSATFAGGDWRVGTPYSSNKNEELKKDDARHFVAFVDGPRGAMAYINDYANLAAPGGPPLVNPDAWRLGVTDLFRLADCAPKALVRPDNSDEMARRWATLYIDGERVRDFRSGLTRDSGGSAANRKLFGTLLTMQSDAIDQLEAVLLGPGYAARTSEVLENLRIWGPDPLKPEAGVIVLARAAPDTIEGLEKLAANTPFDLPKLGAPPYLLNAAEQKALEVTVPEAYRLATQLKQGHVEFRYEDLRFGDVHEVVRTEYVDQFGRVVPKPAPVPPGLNIYPNGPQVFERKVREWFGKARLTLAAYYVHRDRTDMTWPIYRRNFTAPAEVLIGGLKNEEYNGDRLRHGDINWEGEGRRVEKRGEHHGFWFFGSDVDHAIFVDEPGDLRAKQLADHWPAIKAQMLDPAGVADLSAEFSRNLHASLTGEIIRQLTNIEIKAAGGAQGGLGALGNELRCLYGSQMMVYRFLELALPEVFAKDAALQEMLVGKDAVLNWHDLGVAMRPAVTQATDGKYRLEIRGLIKGGADGKRTVPMAATMRLRLDRLRMALDEVVARAAQAPEPPAYPELDDLVAQFPARARRLGIDLKKEVEAIAARGGVKPRPEWFLYREEMTFGRLLDLDPGFQAFANPAPKPTEAR